MDRRRGTICYVFAFSGIEWKSTAYSAISWQYRHGLLVWGIGRISLVSSIRLVGSSGELHWAETHWCHSVRWWGLGSDGPPDYASSDVSSSQIVGNCLRDGSLLVHPWQMNEAPTWPRAVRTVFFSSPQTNRPRGHTPRQSARASPAFCVRCLACTGKVWLGELAGSACRLR